MILEDLVETDLGSVKCHHFREHQIEQERIIRRQARDDAQQGSCIHRCFLVNKRLKNCRAKARWAAP